MAAPGVTGIPRRVPPDFKRDRKTERSVVLPAFHWLVIRVSSPGARKPHQSQSVPMGASPSGSPRQIGSKRKGDGVCEGCEFMGESLRAFHVLVKRFRFRVVSPCSKTSNERDCACV